MLCSNSPTKVQILETQASNTIDTSDATKLSKQASGGKCPVAHLTLRNGVMATDPDHPATPHSCNPNEDADAASVLSRRFMYEVSTDMRQSRKRPREAFDEAVSSVHERFHEYEGDVQRGIQANLNSGYGFPDNTNVSQGRPTEVPPGWQRHPRDIPDSSLKLPVDVPNGTGNNGMGGSHGGPVDIPSHSHGMPEVSTLGFIWLQALEVGVECWEQMAPLSWAMLLFNRDRAVAKLAHLENFIGR
ncbi:hypothetical protein HPB47_007291 [Ixodes persulcatus]|uniref:Uncharacterized protein n=1 Tax=Ixodes persulcatus TaxID=34615 RepID=A0AC60P8A8_IXOPE|nr:hypothetical protein HPB47_007291 [Ixodes persulcatus]